MKHPAMKLFNSLKITAFILVALSSVQCSKYDGENDQFTINSTADGAQVVPSSGSAGTALLAGQYDTHTNTLTAAISWANLGSAPTAIHFHGPALPGKNKIAQFTFTKFPASSTGTMNINAVFTEAQEEYLQQGMFYMDIHTGGNPNGEVRAQIILTK